MGHLIIKILLLNVFTVCRTLSYTLYLCELILTSQEPYEVGTITNLTLQMRKPGTDMLNILPKITQLVGI